MKKNKSRLKLIVLFILSLNSNYLVGQNSIVTIKDVVFMPLNIDSSSVQSYVSFVVDNPSAVSHITYLFGSDKDIGDIITVTGTCVHQGNNHFLNINNTQYPIISLSVKVPFNITYNNFIAINYITVYIDDTTGNFSNKLYFKLKP
ncbi:MAG: hypothetical protein ACK4IK_03475 [Bacteroidia bacterium]